MNRREVSFDVEIPHDARNTPLRREDVAYFRTFGFLVRRALLSPAETRAATKEALRLFREDWGTKFLGDRRQQIQGFVERSRLLSDLIGDLRIIGTVRRLIGNKLIWVGSDGNRYVGNTGWHPDGSNLNLARVKAAFYLQPLRECTGALRVIPGSHLDPLHHQLKTLLQRTNRSITPYGVLAPRRTRPRSSGYGVLPEDVPAYTIETDPGDVVFFNQNIWHGSFGGKTGRTMFTMVLATCPTNEEGWRYVERMYQGQLIHVRRRQATQRNGLLSDLPKHRHRTVRSLVQPLVARGYV